MSPLHSLLATLTCAALLPAQVGGERARFVVRFAPGAFPARAALLDELRARIAARRPAAELEPLFGALRAGCAAARPEFERAVRALGGTVRHRLWLVGAAAVDAPPSARDGLARLPAVVAVDAAGGGTAHIRTATDARNHDADSVQRDRGWRGRGVALALLDSGTDELSGATGAPHPAFTRPDGSSRIARAVDVAGVLGTEDFSGHGTAVAGIALARDWHAPLAPSDDGFAPDAALCSYTITRTVQNDYDAADAIAAWQAVLADRARFGIAVALFCYDGSPSADDLLQRAMDEVALVGDVLIVTSAGNRGGTPAPTIASQANVNGLAVGSASAVTGGGPPHDRHVVSPFSSYGPLASDPERFYPDLVAVGENLVTPVPDVPAAASWPPLSGTSFAAPAVAGTALLLRGRRPALSALDTKALILNSVEDLAAANPHLTRLHYGLGFLRTDLAAEQLEQGRLFGGALRAGTARVDCAAGVTAGVDYAATLAWQRVDTADTDWANLDLTVLDDRGEPIAVSATPRNTYERVLFRPRRSGRYTLRVEVRRLPDDRTPWSLAFGVNRGGGRQQGSYQPLGAGCGRPAREPFAAITLPAPVAGVWGNSRTDIPLATDSIRMQQAYLGADVPAGTSIERLLLRRDELSLGAPSYRADLRVWLGHTARAPHALATVFADNPDAEGLTLVLDDTALDLPGITGLPASPAQFDYALPLDRPFVAQTGAARNLLLELRVYAHSQGSRPFGLWFDGVQSATPRYGMVAAPGDPFAATGRASPVSLVLQLAGGDTTLAPRPPRLEADRPPQLGTTFHAVLRDAPRGAAAALVHGASAERWGAVALPWSLAGLGAPDCALFTSVESLWSGVVGPAGTLQVAHPVPADPALSGVAFYQQFLVLDPRANPLGVAASNAAAGRVGG